VNGAGVHISNQLFSMRISPLGKESLMEELNQLFTSPLVGRQLI
jgi:hypothetical protein